MNDLDLESALKQLRDAPRLPKRPAAIAIHPKLLARLTAEWMDDNPHVHLHDADAELDSIGGIPLVESPVTTPEGRPAYRLVWSTRTKPPGRLDFT